MEPRINFFAANPEAMQALAGLEQRVAKSGLDKQLVELVRIRASQINGCAYCLDKHVADTRKAGETERRVTLVAAWRDTPLFSERERAALEWAEAVTLVADTHVPDHAWEAVQRHFSPAEVVDLTLVVTTINTWNRFAVAFRKLPF